MINFTVGPVQSNNNVLKIGSEQVPYFRTPEFSDLMLENERLILKFAHADENSRCVFITGSGTASMEATIVNTLNQSDKVLVVNGGSFGNRFVELLTLYNIEYTEIKVKLGNTLTKEMLIPHNDKGYTVFIVNIHETSTCIHYDLNIISEFCNKNNLFLIVDAISSFLADEIDMKKQKIDVLIAGSQKALACAPGISILALSNNAIKRINSNSIKCMYLDLREALKNQERGQTPFTPAVGILRQIFCRLTEIDKAGGVKSEIERTKRLAEDFRKKILNLPFTIPSISLSNATTPVHPLNCSAYDIFILLKDEYGIWICPNGGELKDEIFRVGHIGSLTIEDNDRLISALADLKCRKLL